MGDEKPITLLVFPFALKEKGLKDFFEYTLLHLGEGHEIVLGLEKDVSFKLGRERNSSLEKIFIEELNEKISGTIRKGIYSASFKANKVFTEDLGSSYTGLNFIVTPGYKLGELHCDNTSLMLEFGKCSANYFKDLTNICQQES